jgi:hypothetical protein
MQLEERLLFFSISWHPDPDPGETITANPRGSESETVLSFFPRGGSLLSGQLFEGGEQVSVAELQGCVHVLHIRELPPKIVACPLTVLLTVCGVRG